MPVDLLPASIAPEGDVKSLDHRNEPEPMSGLSETLDFSHPDPIVYDREQMYAFYGRARAEGDSTGTPRDCRASDRIADAGRCRSVLSN